MVCGDTIEHVITLYRVLGFVQVANPGIVPLPGYPTVRGATRAHLSTASSLYLWQQKHCMTRR